MTVATTTDAQLRPPYLAAVGTFVAILAIYLMTLAPTTAFWDTSEYIAAAKVLGIPHPPGNPLFVVLAHTFGRLPLAESYAVRINLFAAVTSAAAAGLWFLVAERWLRGIVAHHGARYAAAFTGVLVGATSWTVWNQSTVNEKVYTLSLLSIALVMWLTVRWADDTNPRRDRRLVLIAYVLALTSTNHLMGVLATPAIATYILLTDWRVLTRPRLMAAIGAVVLVGISLNYFWLPLRAAQFPPINEGEPIGLFSQALSDVLNRVQYGKPPLSDRQATFTAQLANFGQYYSWQFARDWGRVAALATTAFSALGLLGLWALWKSDRRAGLTGLVLLGTLSVGLVFYMNFKYGYSMYPNESLPREVRERDYFFVGSFAVFGTFIALGLGATVQSIVRWLGNRSLPAVRWAIASLVLLVGLLPLLGNRETASRAHETLARDFAHDTLESVEPYGILITMGDNDTFPLWYAQEVEGIRRDVTVANLALMGTDWHLRQLRRREPPPFEPARAAALWQGSPAPTRPTSPVFEMTVTQLDSMQHHVNTEQKGWIAAPQQTIAIDSLVIAFGVEYLQLSDIATLFLIRDNLGKRPIHFAWSGGGYPDQTFGLKPYLVTQGLVKRLATKPIVPNDSIVETPLGYTDVARTKTLLRDVYHWPAAARDRRYGWVDRPSELQLDLYRVAYENGAWASGAMGDTAFAKQADAIARRIEQEQTPRTGGRRFRI